MSEERLTPERVRDSNLNSSPETREELMNIMITPQNGRSKIGKDLDEFYEVKHQSSDSNNPTKRSGWEMFSAQTSDTRLSNLDEYEKRYVQWCMKVQGQCLMLGLSKPALFSDWLRSTVCEPSLAKGGFLRTNIQSVNTKNETVSIEQSEPKRDIFGKIKNGFK